MKTIILTTLLIMMRIISIGQNGHLLTTKEIDSLTENGRVKLDSGVYCFPTNFSKDFGNTNVIIEGVRGKTTITSYDTLQPSTNLNPQLLDVTQPDLNVDGVYVVWKNTPYSYGGGFAHLTLGGTYNTNGQEILYIQGSVLKKENGIWSYYYNGYGFKTTRNMIVKDVIFNNCSFYLFSPFGQSESSDFMIKNCVFTNVLRVISSSQYGAPTTVPTNWFPSLINYSNSGGFRFYNLTIDSSQFENVHTSIIWGCPPSRNIKITHNVIKDCPTTVAFFNLYMKKYGDEQYFAKSTRDEVSDNTFTNIVQNNGHTTQLIRTSGMSIIKNNVATNFSPQFVLLYGGGSEVSGNSLTQLQSPWISSLILVKNIQLPDFNKISGNSVNSPSNIFVAVEGSSNECIEQNSGHVKTVYSKNHNSDGSNQFLHINCNTIETETIVNISAKDSVGITFDQVSITNNTFTGVLYFRTGQTPIKTMLIANNQLNISKPTLLYKSNEIGSLIFLDQQ